MSRCTSRRPTSRARSSGSPAASSPSTTACVGASTSASPGRTSSTCGADAMTYDLRNLIDDTTRIVRAESDPDVRCEQITPHLKRRMDQPEPLPEKYTQPCDGGA